MFLFTGRSVRISGTSNDHFPDILHQAVLSGFDWVIYANTSYCRVSVIPDGKIYAITVYITSYKDTRNIRYLLFIFIQSVKPIWTCYFCWINLVVLEDVIII